MSRLLARVARWSLPAALLAATLVAAAGLGGLLFSRPAPPPPDSPVALNLSRPPALPAADDGSILIPQQLTGPMPTPICPTTPRPTCDRAQAVAGLPGCCR